MFTGVLVRSFDPPAESPILRSSKLQPRIACGIRASFFAENKNTQGENFK